MQFDTEDGRTEYFKRIFGGKAEPGAAEDHARTSPLGPCDREELLDDCARIFAEEMRLISTDPRVLTLSVYPIIRETPAFRYVFELWRRETDHKRETALSAVIEAVDPPPPLRTLSAVDRQLLDKPHLEVAKNLLQFARHGRPFMRPQTRGRRMP